jgi:hypothetical protein
VLVTRERAEVLSGGLPSAGESVERTMAQ